MIFLCYILILILRRFFISILPFSCIGLTYPLFSFLLLILTKTSKTYIQEFKLQFYKYLELSTILISTIFFLYNIFNFFEIESSTILWLIYLIIQLSLTSLLFSFKLDQKKIMSIFSVTKKTPVIKTLNILKQKIISDTYDTVNDLRVINRSIDNILEDTKFGLSVIPQMKEYSDITLKKFIRLIDKEYKLNALNNNYVENDKYQKKISNRKKRFKSKKNLRFYINEIIKQEKEEKKKKEGDN